MARYVLLAFESNDEAKEAVQYAVRTAGQQIEEPFQATYPNVEVVGVYAKPTQFCDVMDGGHGNRRVSGFTRGKKFGWWVCALCGKPKKNWADNIGAVLSQARNLLAETLKEDK